MFEIREDVKFKGWYRIWIKTSKGDWLKSRRFSNFERAKNALKDIISNQE